LPLQAIHEQGFGLFPRHAADFVQLLPLLLDQRIQFGLTPLELLELLQRPAQVVLQPASSNPALEYLQQIRLPAQPPPSPAPR
jgi:hypothetical protein